MEILYKGTNYTRQILNSDGSAFANAPHIVLHQRASKDSYEAADVYDVSPGVQERTVYEFLFTAEQTHDMLPGVYDIEVYKNSNMDDMLYYQQDYCKAVETAASLTTQQSNS